MFTLYYLTYAPWIKLISLITFPLFRLLNSELFIHLAAC